MTKTNQNTLALILLALALITHLALHGCATSTEPEPCEPGSPSWPECHEQGQGEGGQ